MMKQTHKKRDILHAPSGFGTQEIQSTLAKDVNLLSKHGLIDYSLLLGVHFLPPARAPNGSNRSLLDSNGDPTHRDWHGCGQSLSPSVTAKLF